MKQKIYILLSGLLMASMMLPQMAKAQYPGGVSSGSTRGFKVDYYNGSFTNATTAFGAGTSNATPGNSGYTNKVTSTEFSALDDSYFGLEYTGKLEITTAGNYKFTLSNSTGSYAFPDYSTLYIDGALAISITGSNGTSANLTLAVGDHIIKVKCAVNSYKLNSSAIGLTFAAVPAGSGITAGAEIDGRFVRSDASKLVAWYKGSDITKSGSNTTGFTNKAPDYAGIGNLSSVSGGAGFSYLVNFNPAVRFDGDDAFATTGNQKDISYRGATKSMYIITDYTATPGQTNSWQFLQQSANSTKSASTIYPYANGGSSGVNMLGLYKVNSTASSMGTGSSYSGAVSTPSTTSAYTTNEPKLLAGFVDQLTGGAAAATTNPFSLDINGTTGSVTSIAANTMAYNTKGLYLGLQSTSINNPIDASIIPEAIYYPFKLDATQEKKVNTYLGVKYGISLSSDYVNTSGTVIFDNAVAGVNTGYRNRIFGIGRELTVEALNQKQSQSQMVGAAGGGYDFLVISKGTTIAANNAANTGVLNEGDYLLLSDDNAAMSAQNTELPVNYISGCAVSRLSRKWKAQVTGTPGAVTIRAGSSTGGSYKFSNSVSGVKLVVDGDGDGDFTTGAAQQTMYDATSVTNGVATFTGVTIPNGAVITFAWTAISPGGVSNGLTFWYNGTQDVYTDLAGTAAAANGSTVALWKNQASGLYDLNNNSAYASIGTTTYYKTTNLVNFNPSVGFNSSVLYAGLTTNYTAANSTAFLSGILDAAATDHRRFVLKNTANGDDNNVNSVRFFSASPSVSANMYTYRLSAIRGNSILPQFGKPGVYSTVHSGTITVNLNNGLGVTSTTYSLAAPDANQLIVGGSRDASNAQWIGKSSALELYTEAVLYNRSLTDIERQRVETYLAIKNGTTIDISAAANYGSQYIASDGVTNIYNYNTYANSIFGIGRDDCSGLGQNQSQSTTGFDNITIGLSSIAATNASNTSTFASNLQFIMIGNDGGALTGTAANIPSSYTALSCNPSRYIRNWKVKNTGGVSSALQIKAGNSTYPITSNWSNVTLAVNTTGDNTFATGTTVLYPASALNGGVATFNNVALPDGAVFTICYTVGYPGGVGSNIALWLRADGGTSTSTSGSTTTSWNDMRTTINSNAGSATYMNDGTANYNPYISFDGSANYFGYPSGFNNFTAGNTSFFTVNFANLTQNGPHLYDFGNGAPSNNMLFGKITTTANLGMYGINGTTGGGNTITTSSPIITGQSRIYSALMPAGAAGTSVTSVMGVDGTNSTTTGTVVVPGVVSRSNNYIARSAWVADDYFNGSISEGIVYNTVLTAAQQQKINSYMAIRYGRTLSTDYLASDGSTIWNATTAATFRKDVTGIGRDDCGALNQLQSTSTDSLDIVSMGLGAIATTNALNTNNFATDKNFLVWARNTGTLTTMSDVLPSSLTGCYVRLNREWQVQATGTPGAVSIQLGKNNTFSFGRTTFKPVLLISSTSGAGAYSAATIVNADSIVNGYAYFNNVSFTGTKYFTVAYIIPAPGGVSAGLTLWTDAAQTSMATGNVAQWTDLSPNSNHLTRTASSGVQKTTSTLFNFNPSIQFGAADNAYLSSTNTLGLNGKNTYAEFYTLKMNFPSGLQWDEIITLGTNGSTGTSPSDHRWESTSTSLGTATYGIYGSGTASVSVTSRLASLPTIYSNSANGTNAVLRTNGKTEFTNATSAGLITPNLFRIGTDIDASGTANGNYNGFWCPEVVVYNTALTTTDISKVNSYLAVKYGLTLDASVGSYIASDNTAIYNNTAYWSNITGIGRDDCSGIEQKQSFSQESTDALVTISADAVNGISTLNSDNAATFTADKSFLLFGDNNKSLTWTGVDKIPGNLVRLNRIWNVKETGTVGSVYLQVPSSVNAATYKLPAADVATVYLLVSHTGNFKNPDASILMTDDGSNNLYATYDFADGDYYTFASQKSCIAPAGISDGLTTWYRTDDLSVGTITSLADRMGNINMTQYGTGTASVVAATATNNYNKYLQLAAGTTGGSSFASATNNQPETALTSATSGTLYGVTFGTGKDRLFSVTRSNYTTIEMTSAFVNQPAVNNTVLSATYPAGTSGAANLWSMTWDGSQVRAYANGTAGGSQAYSTGLTANSTHFVGIGGSYNSSTYTRSGIAFNEAFSYNRVLTTAEQQVLNTYLALKYGQTLAHTYYSPDYNGSNGAATTIYDVSTYGNRVFGIGVDSAGCFSQNQSTSVISGSMLKMTIDGSITATNSHDMSKFASNRTYVAAGDDNTSIASWNTTETPAIYASANLCVTPQRITREWKFKALNSDQAVLVTIPDPSATATVKLPSFPVGSTKVYMIVNDNSDFTTNANQEEVPMTFNTTSKEWEATYSFPNGTYKYVTFVTKADLAGLPPVAITTTTQDGVVSTCDANQYIYYRGTLNSTKAILAINPNSNSWNPSGVVTVDNTGTLTGGGGTFTNSGTGYYQSTDGINTIRITKRLHTIIAPGSYTINNGVIVRVYYDPADLTNLQGDAMPGGAAIAEQGWFKAETSSAATTVNNMIPGNLTNAKGITPIASGQEQGVYYVEFLVTSFSTFGYYAKTTPFVLPVKLISFTSAAKDCKTVLNWKTAEESGFDHFEIERSTNSGTSYNTIGTVAASGTNSNYSYEDITAAEGKNLYRLKMIDADGKYKYSSINIVALNCNGKSSIIIYPNPATEVLKVSINGYLNKVTGKLYNSLGQLEKTVALVNGTNDIQTGALSNGLYNLVITDEAGKTNTYKVMVKH